LSKIIYIDHGKTSQDIFTAID